MWRTADPAHSAGRLDSNIHPLAVVMAVSYRIGGEVGRGWDNIAVRWSRTQLWACGEEGKRSNVDNGRPHRLGWAVGYQ